MRIIPRSEWGARYPDGFRAAPLPAREVWLHHSVTNTGPGTPTGDAAAVRALEQIGQQRFGGGISYTWVVTRAGRVYQGHSPGRQGAHTGGRNDIARAVCLLGNYDTTVPTGPQLDAVAWLLGEAHRRGWIARPRLNGGHRDAPGASTICPGRHAWALIGEINKRAAGQGAGGGSGDDMPLSEADLKKIEAIVDRKMRAGVRYIDNGDPDQPYEGHTTKKVREDLAGLRQRVEQIAAQSAGVTPGEVREIVREELAGDITLTASRRDPQS